MTRMRLSPEKLSLSRRYVFLLLLVAKSRWSEGSTYRRANEGLRFINASEIPDGTSRVIYAGNYITSLEPLDEWLNGPNLDTLNVANNNISTLGTIFVNSTLQKLYLGFNPVGNLAPGTFKGGELKELFLTTIGMTEFPELDENVGTLIKLSLNNNSISYIDDAILLTLTKLKEFYVADTNITVFPDISKMRVLKYLNVKGNNISTIPAEYFDEITAMTDVNLKDNQILDFSFLADIKCPILNLNIDNNPGLSNIDAGLINNITTISTLDLSVGKLECLEKPADRLVPILIKMDQTEIRCDCCWSWTKQPLPANLDISMSDAHKRCSVFGPEHLTNLTWGEISTSDLCPTSSTAPITTPTDQVTYITTQTVPVTYFLSTTLEYEDSTVSTDLPLTTTESLVDSTLRFESFSAEITSESKTTSQGTLPTTERTTTLSTKSITSVISSRPWTSTASFTTEKLTTEIPTTTEMTSIIAWDIWSAWTKCHISSAHKSNKLVQFRFRLSMANDGALLSHSFKLLPSVYQTTLGYKIQTRECVEEKENDPILWVLWSDWADCTGDVVYSSRTRGCYKSTGKICSKIERQSQHCPESNSTSTESEEEAVEESSWTEADNRPSAKATGGMGISLIASLVAIMFLLDLFVGERSLASCILRKKKPK